LNPSIERIGSRQLAGMSNSRSHAEQPLGKIAFIVLNVSDQKRT
jgi:hypothetical protein